MSKELFPGLPEDLMDFVDDSSKNSETPISIKLEKRKYGKIWAVISNLNLEKSQMKTLLKTLKNKLACGGTMKNNVLEVSFGKSDKTKLVISYLVLEGFKEENICILK